MTAKTLRWAAELLPVAERYADRSAAADLTDEISFARLFRKAAGLGLELIGAGIRPGESVATFLRNGIPAVWASYGVVLSGAAETPLNPGLSEADRRHCLSLAGVRHVVTTAAAAPFFRDLGLLVHCVEEIGEAELDPGSFPCVPTEAWGKIVFTSGTTGLAKGVVHSQHGRWLANVLLRASLPASPRPGDRVLLMTPYSHGASLLAYAYLDHGASIAVLDGVDPDVVLPMIQRAEIQDVFAPPTVLAKLVSAAGDRRYPGLRTIFCGTAVLTPALYARVREIFGPVIRITYGKSEIFNPITVLSTDETEAWYTHAGANADACVGWPASGVEIVVRHEDGSPCHRGVSGEVFIRARHMMAGYLLPTEGYRPMGPGQFHATGDLGYVDSLGRLHLVGRAADVIKTGGYKVEPEEIERLLAPMVRPGDVAVVGLASEYWGEIIVATVEGVGPDWEARVRQVCREMTAYKRPRALIAMDELPRNAMGKIRRAAIREHILKNYRVIDGPHPRLEPREH